MILFYSYSHQDEGLRAELDAHLSRLKLEGVLESWHDRAITPGSNWRNAIQVKLDTADIILFLISADFLASDYCYGVEVQRALERHRAGAAIVVPVILRACDWRLPHFAELQALPEGCIPVTSWKNRDEAWANVVQGITRVIGEKRAAAHNRSASEVLLRRPASGASEGNPLGQATGSTAKELAEIFLKAFTQHPYMAASAILFIALNALIGAVDKLLSLLPRLGLPRDASAAPKSYALLLATAGTLLALAYHGVVTAMKSPKNEGEFNRPEITFIDRFFGHSLKYEVLPIVSCCVLLNVAGAFIASTSWNLLFLDTIGTFLGAVLLGPYWGATIGLATNVCASMIINSNAFLWAGVNALLGLSWGYVSRNLRLYEHLVSSPFKAITPRRMFLLFVLPAILISSGASTVIKVSIYDPQMVRLFYDSSWITQKYFLDILGSHMPAGIAYFFGDLARNTCDKLIVVLIGMLFLLGRSVSLSRSREVVEPYGRRLPIHDIGTGQVIIFAVLYLVALFELLPFGYVYDRQSAGPRSITLNFLSWGFLSLPLYITIAHLAFSQAEYVGMEERDNQRRGREVLYKQQLSMAKGCKMLSWFRWISVTLALVVIGYLLVLHMAITSISPPLKLTISQGIIALGAIAAGLYAGIVLWLLFAIEDTAGVDRACQ